MIIGGATHLSVKSETPLDLVLFTPLAPQWSSPLLPVSAGPLHLLPGGVIIIKNKTGENKTGGRPVRDHQRWGPLVPTSSPALPEWDEKVTEGCVTFHRFIVMGLDLIWISIDAPRNQNNRIWIHNFTILVYLSPGGLESPDWLKGHLLG